jgi:hypothetical protein
MEMKIDDESLAELQNTISRFRGDSKQVLKSATNDVLGGIKTRGAQLIGQKVNLSAALIKKAFKIQKMTVADMSAVVACSGEPVPLINYKATSVKKGVSVKVLKAGTKKLIKHAFIAVMGSDHKGVFWRKDKYTGKVWKVGVKRKVPTWEKGDPRNKFRLKIVERYGPRVPDVFDDTEIMAQTMKEASIRFDARLKHHTDRMIAAAR